VSDTGPNRRRIAVTGGGGFIGCAVIRTLRERGHTAIPIVRRGGGDRDERVISDIADRLDLEKAFTGVDTVIHLAASVHESAARYPDDELHRINVGGTRAVYEVAAELGIRRVLFASSAKAEFVRADGNGCRAPPDVYGASKLKAEEFVSAFARREALHAPILRLPLTYGPGVRANMLTLFRVVDRQLPLPLASVQNRRSVVYVENVAAAVSTLLEFPGTLRGVYSVSDPQPLSTPELIRAIARALERRAFLLPMNPTFLRRAASALAAFGVEQPLAMLQRLTDSLVIDPRPLAEVTAFEPPFTTAVGLAHTAQWFRTSWRGRR
jgi:nucleoside-diphosphate-sugar epimerase